MSSEAQIKKRRDNKKKRKDDAVEESDVFAQEQTQLHSPKSTVNGDLDIHVHKESTTGGGLCAKLVFFVLLTILIALIALLVSEHHENEEFEVVEPQFSKLSKRSIDELARSVEESEDHAYEEDELETDEEYEHSDEEREAKSTDASEENKEDDKSDTPELSEDQDDEDEDEPQSELPDDSTTRENSEEHKSNPKDGESEETDEVIPTMEAPKDKNDFDELQEDKENYHSLKVHQDESESENGQESDGPQSIYQYSDVTNSDDWIIREEVDRANGALDAAYALILFNKLLEKNPFSPRGLYGKAKALDFLAEKKQSNNLLQESIRIFEGILKLPNVPDALFELVAERCINRMRFRGKYTQAVPVHNMLIKKFPNEIRYRNELTVTYLTMNNVAEAKKVLHETLSKWPDDGFALVHYGFILKTNDNDLETSLAFLQRGINTKASGVIDGRFYFHLGDALMRLGKKEEALKVYEDGVSNGLFLSKYQRSLYNVARLSAKPWWSKKDFSSTTFFDYLEKNWQYIRNEGLNILNKEGYFKPETENLRDVGEWKQFELYARGNKNVAHCKQCPMTCEILAHFSEATTCRRGQIKFSVMHPGTHVWPHCGPTNCRLRVHLGLKVPLNTYIRVADEIRSWEEGKLLIFDDSFEHEVWHNGTSVRLVLIVDIWHPELTKKEKQSLSSI